MAEPTAAEIDALRLIMENATGPRVQPKKPPVKPTPPPPQPNKRTQVSTTPKRFGDLAKVTVSLTSTPKPWKDADIKDIQITKIRQLSSAEMITAGRSVLEAIESDNISSSIIDTILQLAVSIISPSHDIEKDKKILIPLPDDMGKVVREASANNNTKAGAEGKALQDKLSRAQRNVAKAKTAEEKKQFEELERKIREQMEGPSQSAVHIGSEDDAFVYGYIAAYIMRLPGKMADKWVEKIETAKSRFNGWFDCTSTVMDEFDISEDSATKLREALARRPDAVSTWVLWVAYNENENPMMELNDRGMMTYLAQQMYSYTGMNAYASVLSLSIDHNMTFDVLLDELYCPATQQAVEEIANIIRNHEVTEGFPNRKTYFRYARVWDSGYFVQIQSKKCVILGYTVAKAKKMLSSSTAGSDPTQAMAYKGIDDKLKTSLDKVADNLYDLILSRATKGKDSGSIWHT